MVRVRESSGGTGQGGAPGFPLCRSCDGGELVPLSDYGGQGSAVQYKAWVCTNPECGFNIKIRNGDVTVNEPVFAGEAGRREAQAHAQAPAQLHPGRFEPAQPRPARMVGVGVGPGGG